MSGNWKRKEKNLGLSSAKLSCACKLSRFDKSVFASLVKIAFKFAVLETFEAGGKKLGKLSPTGLDLAVGDLP